MKVSLERAVLLRALSHAHSTVERRNSIPILSNVLLNADDGILIITATDLELQIVEAVSAEVHEPGRITVSAHTLFEIVRKLPDGARINLTASQGSLSVVAGRARFNLPLLPAEDFPDIVAGDLPVEFHMEAEALAELLGKTKFAMSHDDTRYYLNGIYLHAAETDLVAVATDGHRLAQVRVAMGSALPAFPGIIIPRKCVNEFQKVLADVEGSVRVALSSSKVQFELQGVKFTSKLVDGTFPNYERVIPQNNPKLATVSAKTVAQGIDRVATVSTERTSTVRMELAPDRLVLSVTSPETGRADEEVEVRYEGEAFIVGFNGRYMTEIMAQNRDGDMELAFSEPSSPILIRPVGRQDELYVLMPMRV